MTANILILRDPARVAPTPCAPESFSRPRIRFAKNLTEAKAHLLRCIGRVEAGLFAIPAYVLLDTAAQDIDIKRELDRWMTEQPALHGVQVLLATELSTAAKLWSALGRLLRLW